MRLFLGQPGRLVLVLISAKRPATYRVPGFRPRQCCWKTQGSDLRAQREHLSPAPDETHFIFTLRHGRQALVALGLFAVMLGLPTARWVFCYKPRGRRAEYSGLEHGISGSPGGELEMKELERSSPAIKDRPLSLS